MADAAQQTLEQLREQREALTLKVQVHALERQARIAELQSRRIVEGWGDLIDPREYLLNEPGWYQPGTISRRATRHDDRDGGRDRPFIESEEDLAVCRGIGRYLAKMDETSIGILDNLTNYTIDRGLSYSAAPRRKGVSVPAGLIQELDDFLDEFVEGNKWRRREREDVVRTHRDGEFFNRLRHVGGGRVRSEVIEPDHITEPLDKRSAAEWAGVYDADWLFGIATAFGDVETVYGYWIDPTRTGRDCEFVPADEMEHCKGFNVDESKVKRGISDYYAAYTEIDQADKVSHNTAEGAAIQAAIAFIREHAEGTTKSAVETFLDDKNDFTRTRYVPAGLKSIRTTEYEAASVLDVLAGTKYKEGPMGSQRNPQFIQTVQMVLRRVGVRWQMPEFMVSGDASNANYSNTLVAESPFVKSTGVRQTFYEETFVSLLWKAINLAMRWGRFARYRLSCEQIKRLVKIAVEAPDVAVRDRDKETNRRSIMLKDGVLSPQTYAEQEDLDYDEEVARGAKRIEQPMQANGSPIEQQTQTDDPAAAAGVNAVQDTALSGVQIEALMGLIDKLVAKQYPPETVKQLAAAAFPAMDQGQIAAIVDSLKGWTPAVPVEVKPVSESRKRWLSRIWEGYP